MNVWINGCERFGRKMKLEMQYEVDLQAQYYWENDRMDCLKQPVKFDMLRSYIIKRNKKESRGPALINYLDSKAIPELVKIDIFR